jgi:DNA adenine methylase
MKSVKQLLIFPDMELNNENTKPVNVSSVPQRSPFRYPGGKTWFIPTFRKWIRSKTRRINLLVEPFAGGGIVSLTSLFENHVENAVMVEIDNDVAAVWQTVVDGNSKWLADRIIQFDMTRESVIRELSRQPDTTRERAFQTIIKNRTFHGGILANGAGFMKKGDNGKGIGSRWYPQTLAKRFKDLEFIANRIIFYQKDGIEIIKKYIDNPNAVFFIDPPYTAGGKNAGKRLYKHSCIEHEYLFELCRNIRGDFIMTYDNADEVREMAKKENFEVRLIPMKNTHNSTMKELVIGKDLNWMDMD